MTIGYRKLICTYPYGYMEGHEELSKTTLRVMHVPEHIAEQVIAGFKARGWEVVDEPV